MLSLEYRMDAASAMLLFDDDGKTGYAYLYLDNKIVGDVWLYNVGVPPQQSEWGDPANLPFANTVGFVSDEKFEPITESEVDQIALDWHVEASTLRQVTVFLREIEHAVLRPGAKPGWCRLAARQGPLAKPLRDLPPIG